MPRGKTQLVGNLVGGVVRRWERRAGGPIERIICCWPDVVGASIARSSRPVETEGKTLLVEVRDAVWRDQLARFYKGKILGKLNSRLGGELLRDIRFLVGRDASQWETP